MELLYYLYSHKDMNPMEVYRQGRGALDLLRAFAEFEAEHS